MIRSAFQLIPRASAITVRLGEKAWRVANRAWQPPLASFHLRSGRRKGEVHTVCDNAQGDRGQSIGAQFIVEVRAGIIRRTDHSHRGLQRAVQNRHLVGALAVDGTRPRSDDKLPLTHAGRAPGARHHRIGLASQAGCDFLQSRRYRTAREWNKLRAFRVVVFVRLYMFLLHGRLMWAGGNGRSSVQRLREPYRV